MKNILLIGAGRSSYSLIEYLLEKGKEYSWFITVADTLPENAREKIGVHNNGRAIWLDVMKSNDRKELIARADVVISMLPAHLHLEVAHDCIKLNKDLLTSAYISQEMYRLGDEARERELLFTGEMGLDSSIEHMIAKQDLDEIRGEGGKILAFRSYAGALLSPASPGNPWSYKLTWNPRNVVLAGQGMAQYLVEGKLKYIPYSKLFKQTDRVEIPNLGVYEAYANRDSLLFQEIYGLKDIPNIYRGTLRTPGFGEAWDALIQLGLTDGDFPILHAGQISYYDFLEAIVGEFPGITLKERVAAYLSIPSNHPIISKLHWLGLFSKKKIRLSNATPALILEKLLLDKWELKAKDKDAVIIHHELDFEKGNKKWRRKTTMYLEGANDKDTALARVIGLPVGILLKMLMENKISGRGLKVPIMPSVYTPVLQELEEYGIKFDKQDKAI